MWIFQKVNIVSNFCLYFIHPLAFIWFKNYSLSLLILLFLSSCLESPSYMANYYFSNILSIQIETYICKISMLPSSNETNPMKFIFLSLGCYLTHCDYWLFWPFIFEFHNLFFLKRWIIFQYIKWGWWWA